MLVTFAHQKFNGATKSWAPVFHPFSSININKVIK